ncbi:hypothetical protein, partial [[Mycoplasma] collis]|uniref:hypothetical protein n=1 Tax=[Mycoplasma] collis TaxID=2127 RepID=UPI00051BED71
MFVLDLDVKDNLNNSKIVNVSKENKNKDIFNNNINQSAKFLKIALESKNKKNLIKKLNNLLEGEFSFFESKYTNYVFINFYNNWEKYITNNLKKIFENNKDF